MSPEYGDIAAAVIAASGGRVEVSAELLHRVATTGARMAVHQEYDPVLCMWTFSLQPNDIVVDGDVIGPRELPAPAPALPAGGS